MGILTSPFLIRLSRWLERFLYARAKHVLVNSPAYRDYLLRKGLPSQNITLIPNGVDPSMFNGAVRGSPLRRAWSLDRKFVVTYAGALGPANDIATVLHAAARIQEKSSNVHFLIVGDGKDCHSLETLAHHLGLENVTFVGVCPKRDMPGILAASDACTAILKNIPMFKTTYPNKVFDYMAAGRPTILAIDGVIREVLDKAGGGVFVPPGNDEAFAEAVLALEKDKERAKAMGRAARRYVREHFDRKRHAEAFLELLEYMAGR